MAESVQFRFRAIDSDGRKVGGRLDASTEASAHQALRARGLTPLSLRRDRRPAARPSTAKAPPDRECAEFLASLADLLRAGSDIRTALGILGARADKAALKQLTKALNDDISRGDSLDRAFARSFDGRQAFVPSMVAAGEAGGDLPGGLQRAADVYFSRLRLRDQLISVLAYPAFVFVSAIAAIFVILLFIVPSIAPLAAEAGTQPPPSLGALIAASDFLRANLSALAAGFLGGLILIVAAARAGLLTGPVEALLLDGPARRTVRALAYGGFAISLGTMLAAGTPMTDALRLANRSVMTRTAQRRLGTLVRIVGQGQSVSSALESVPGFPGAIIRLAAVGEATNALGQMLAKGGRLEEEAAMRRIEALGRIAGPALIVILGMILGVLMGGLLTGVSQMGQSALG